MRSPLPRLAASLAVAALAVALSGCISVFPKKDPAVLYRFGGDAAEQSQSVAQADGVAVPVLKAPIGFTRAAATDRILTVTGTEAAYIAAARWVSPAAVLFDEDVERAVLRAPGPVRLIGRGEVAKAAYSLKIDVQTFEARYESGRGVGPTVVVEARAILTRAGSDRSLVGDRLFTATARASEDRVGPIVAAYDAAEAKVVADLVAWLNSEARALPPQAPATP